jgi:hypothetical protein
MWVYGEEVTGDWRHFHTGSFSMYFSIRMTQVIELVGLRWSEDVGGGVEKKSNAYAILVRQTDRKRIHARHTHTLDDLKEI